MRNTRSLLWFVVPCSMCKMRLPLPQPVKIILVKVQVQ